MLKNLLRLLSLAVIGLLLFAGLVFWQSMRIWSSVTAREETVLFTVETGTSVNQIVEELHANRLIANKFWFKAYLKLDGSARKLQAGVFELRPGMGYARVVDTLTSAEKDEVTLTIPEGYTLKQIGELVVANFDITEAQWRVATGVESPFEESHPFVVAAQKPDDVDLEGYLFPDTYRFFKNSTAEDIVDRLIDEMEENVNGRSYSGYTIHESLTLASIVEREVRGANDMNIVAGLFYNRLNIGMALQADSTVNYVTGKDTPSISLADRDIESPYNTYKYPGLPPGPISSPGLNALNAVFSPATTNYLYFLTSPEGTVYYGTTFEEHGQNRARYLR